MKKKIGNLPFLVVGIIILTVLASSGVKAGSKAVVEGNTEFALDLYRELKDTKGNIFFSPYSISTALAMTYAGAREDTAKQMADVLHFTLDQQELHPAFAKLEALLNAIQSQGNIQLNVANSLWPQKGYPFPKEYLNLAKKN